MTSPTPLTLTALVESILYAAGEPAAVRAPSKVADDVMQKAAPAALSRKAH